MSNPYSERSFKCIICGKRYYEEFASDDDARTCQWCDEKISVQVSTPIKKGHKH